MKDKPKPHIYVLAAIYTALAYLLPIGLIVFAGYHYYSLHAEIDRLTTRVTKLQDEATLLNAELDRLDKCGARCGDCPPRRTQ